jgi:NADH dehydrogenase FAD-containing subunit
MHYYAYIHIRFYPHLVKYVRIKLVEASDRVLMAFDEKLQAEALENLTNRKTTLIEQGYSKQEMAEVLLKVGVKAVTDTVISLSNGIEMPYGLAVWAAGNSPLPLVVDLIEQNEKQKEKSTWGRGRLVYKTYFLNVLNVFIYMQYLMLIMDSLTLRVTALAVCYVLCVLCHVMYMYVKSSVQLL